jgi:co-chaperonin GroES (HSP10)
MVMTTSESALAEAFPAVEAGIQPFGSRVLIQIRTPKSKTAGGIILHSETKDTEKWNTQVGKVVSVGPLAFKNRNTMDSWPEGSWCKEGDFVRVAKYGGDRWEVATDKSDQSAMFVIFNDLDIIGQVTGDPLKIKAFI